jgi:hypothetical protein
LLHGALGVTTRIFNFLVVCRKFNSGADGIRTHALRRAKAARSLHHCSLLLKNPHT